ncbi:hypothetical protein HYN69_16100 [Gemmobacter aquarius]|uniref:Zinc finger/thioredoxin putative domain-containing protein n=1 Tax=Paragemmobacter aquarius TaxID=2169400 RepID=A0A2S0UPU4_9RHOB|nr:zinc-ribbon domain-containing protein [Gemmobacter aquarius]AWB49824.1 hypothetical protein HYN69_16100 [Gemmobacter aquarius]
MRLICPNCDAEYEVDDAAIPDGGRDVQCSNCGHGWFQLPAGYEAEKAEEEALFGVEEDTAAPPAGQPVPVQRTLDENLMAVLREEAEREAAARKAEATPIETQTEMPLAAPPVSEAARRIARLKGVDPDAPAPAPARPGSRRSLLPDIEEINSSLRTAAPADDADEDEPPAARRGFRSGFMVSVLVAAAGVGAYAMAPRLAEQLPGAKPVLDSYVSQIDSGRLWLDAAMRQATEAIRAVTATDGG